MTTKLQELSDEYSNYIAAPPAPDDVQGALASMTVQMDDVDLTKDVTVGDPISHEMDASSVTIYANSINPVSSMGDAAIVEFDVVFSVGCVCPESGRTSTYQVVKRIGIDKLKIANDAKKSTPVSIVESKQQRNPAGLTAARFKTLAGLN